MIRYRTASTIILLAAVVMSAGCGPSPEEIADQQAAVAARERQAEKEFCIRTADLVNTLYPVYRQTFDTRAMFDSLDQSASVNQYTPFQWNMSRDAILFAQSLPGDLPRTEPGKRWIDVKCG